MTVPFFARDLFEDARETFLDIVHEIGVSDGQRFILGAYTAAFEKALRHESGAGDAIACASGTAALTLSLHAAGVRRGDEAIVPALGSEPLAASVVNLGAVPVFADVRTCDMTIDSTQLVQLTTDRTRAIVAAHAFSSLADMPEIMGIGERLNLPVIEDAAVAQGAMIAGRPAGTWGDLGVFSFFPVKALGAVGEGGVVLTDTPALGQAVRMLRNHGQDGLTRFLHHEVGYNSRFDEVLAAFQLHQLSTFTYRLARRAQVAEYYSARFAELAGRGVVAPPPGRADKCNYVYALLVDRRDEFRRYLLERGVTTWVHYPIPLPQQAAFARFGDRQAAQHEWPGADWVSRHHVAIPLWPHLAEPDAVRVADAVCGFFS